MSRRSYQRYLERKEQEVIQKLNHSKPPEKSIDDIFAELGFKKTSLFNKQSFQNTQRRPKLPVGECGKVIFPSERLAKEAIHYRQQNGTGGAKSLLAYHCKPCGGWHLSSRPTDGLKG